MSIKEATKENFNEEVLSSSIPVLVDFWAPWCGYCRRLSPVIDKISQEYQDKIKVVKLDIDEAEEIADKYEVNTIPSLILFKDGKNGEMIINPKSKAEIDQWISQQL